MPLNTILFLFRLSMRDSYCVSCWLDLPVLCFWGYVCSALCPSGLRRVRGRGCTLWVSFLRPGWMLRRTASFLTGSPPPWLPALLTLWVGCVPGSCAVRSSWIWTLVRLPPCCRSPACSRFQSSCGGTLLYSTGPGVVLTINRCPSAVSGERQDFYFC